MNDPLDKFVTFAVDSVNSQSNQVGRRPPQHLAMVPPITARKHHWRKGLLGGPMRCSDCKVRMDQAGENGCQA